MAEHDDISGAMPWIISALIAAGAAMWALGKRLFSSVTREELRQTLTEMRADRMQLHHENIAKFDELFERLGELEQGQARLEGRLSGRLSPR